MKMTRHLICIFLTIGFISCGLNSNKDERVKSGEIEISWVDNLPGDFSFAKNWDYPEGVYRNEFGQLSCDGLCPQEVDRMMDENGKIYEDSFTAFFPFNNLSINRNRVFRSTIVSMKSFPF